MITRGFEAEMVADGCGLEEIAMMTLALAHPEMKQVGALYRPNEWDDHFGGREHVTSVLERLQDRGKLVLDGYWLLVPSWLRRYAFTQPNYFKSGLYALSHQVKSPLMRMVIATELLRLPLSEKTSAELEKSRIHAIAAEYWMELTGRDLVAHTFMTGSLEHPQPTMLEQIVDMPDAATSYRQLRERNWSVIHPLLREHLERALSVRYEPRGLPSITGARVRHA